MLSVVSIFKGGILLVSQANSLNYRRSIIQSTMKSILLFYFELCVINIPFSFLIGLLSGSLGTGFPLSLASGGMLLSLYLYNAEKYFFFYNRGISKQKLLVSAALLNLALALLILFLQRLFDG